jgi:hypothetical protein
MVLPASSNFLLLHSSIKTLQKLTKTCQKALSVLPRLASLITTQSQEVS